MIKDKLENSEQYYGISENLKKGFEWLKAQDLNSLKSGKYYIDDKKIYANLQEYQTKPDAKYEAHNKYIDIQYIVNGVERIGVSDRISCETCIPYDSDDDIEFMTLSGTEEWQSLREGEFLVLFPNDAHKPSITPEYLSGKENIVKKVVVKVSVD